MLEEAQCLVVARALAMTIASVMKGLLGAGVKKEAKVLAKDKHLQACLWTKRG